MGGPFGVTPYHDEKSFKLLLSKKNDDVVASININFMPSQFKNVNAFAAKSDFFSFAIIV